jgi:hypothetical protein
MIKRLFLLLVLALLMTGCAGTISPYGQERIVITNDRGGFIDRFIKKYQRWNKQNKIVVVDGYCASSCTMVIGMISRSRLCVTRNAVFGFHGSYYNAVFITGPKIENPDQTHLMTDRYTDDVRAWVDARGGLTTYKKMLIMKYPETLQFFRAC